MRQSKLRAFSMRSGRQGLWILRRFVYQNWHTAWESVVARRLSHCQTSATGCLQCICRSRASALSLASKRQEHNRFFDSIFCCDATDTWGNQSSDSRILTEIAETQWYAGSFCVSCTICLYYCALCSVVLIRKACVSLRIGAMRIDVA